MRLRIRRAFQQLQAHLTWRYNHWVCSVDGHVPKTIASLLLLALTPGKVCERCGDWIQELDPVRRAREARKAKPRVFVEVSE